ncbi:hypothetical protein [Marinobacterium sedimentorum]|uniref:hypothetical protein n=1 Tax=Marinobacterium sedimentorum TaxID=2927804 RepID=UPI0020C63FD1|nr:hypothetical protein [Marinobacterium sedimentorum]MCP8690041.1 hypothetical protein [Marinobacterium sedimentorum]
MKQKIKSLTEIQRYILRNRILDQPKRPFGFSFAALYGSMDIAKYPEDDVLTAIEDMVEKGLFEKRHDGAYIFSREQFLNVKPYFKMDLFLQNFKKSSMLLIKFIWKHFIVTILAAVLTAYVTTIITLKVKSSKAKDVNEQIIHISKDNVKIRGTK